MSDEMITPLMSSWGIVEQNADGDWVNARGEFVCSETERRERVFKRHHFEKHMAERGPDYEVMVRQPGLNMWRIRPIGRPLPKGWCWTKEGFDGEL